MMKKSNNLQGNGANYPQGYPGNGQQGGQQPYGQPQYNGQQYGQQQQYNQQQYNQQQQQAYQQPQYTPSAPQAGMDLSKPVFGRFQVIKEIGKGKHGVVYEATDLHTNQTVAVKTIQLPNEEMMQYAHDEYGDDQEAIANFVGEVAEKFGNEIASMTRMNGSRAAITLYDNQLMQNGIHYDIIMVMEFARPMKKYFKEKPLKYKDFFKFATEIAEGLMMCEQQGIIHRDIKEDNLFVGLHDGCAKMGDFGVASVNENHLGSTVGMGTPYYMAPEVTNSKHYTHTADIYSFGIVMYKMLNGNRFPFADGTIDSAKAGLDKRMAGEVIPAPKFANEELTAIVRRCCAYYAEDRFQTAQELYNALRAAEAHMAPDQLMADAHYLDGASVQTAEFSADPAPRGGGSASFSQNVADSGAYEGPQGGGQNGAAPQNADSGMLAKTMDILHSIISHEGRNSTVAVVFNGLLQLVSKGQADALKEEYKKRKKRNIIIAAACGLVLLSVILVLLYPKTATFYADTSDNNMLHVKYLFLPDRRVGAEVPAAYVSVDGNWIYYHNPTVGAPDHGNLYKLSVWGGDPVKLCDDVCEYNIVIGDYVYYTNDKDKFLYRVKTDGTAKQLVLDQISMDLKRNGDNLIVKVGEEGKLFELDTNSIE